MRLQRYILRELLATFALIALIVSGVMFAALLLQFLHKYPELGALAAVSVAPWLLPVAFPITLPLSFLVACLLTYGRFSDDNEFLAMQMGGVHPWHAAAPAVATGAVLAFGTVLLNTDVIPFATLQKKEIARSQVREILRAVDDPSRDSLPPLGPFRMSWNGRDARGLKDVLISIQPRDDEDVDGRAPLPRVVHAERGRLDASRLEHDQVVLDLDGVVAEFGTGEARNRVQEENRLLVLDIDALAGQPPSLKNKRPAEMTASQLYYKARRLREIAQSQPSRGDARRDRAEDFQAVWEYETSYWERIATGMAPLAFAFVGVGLGLAGGKSSRMAAFLLAIVIALPVYHPLLLGGKNLARSGILPAALAVNLGNVLLAGFGLWRFGRSAR